ncbi:hypothetical protein KIPB_010432, partial [Kipferlia bialata]
ALRDGDLHTSSVHEEASYLESNSALRDLESSALRVSGLDDDGSYLDSMISPSPLKRDRQLEDTAREGEGTPSAPTYKGAERERDSLPDAPSHALSRLPVDISPLREGERERVEGQMERERELARKEEMEREREWRKTEGLYLDTQVEGEEIDVELTPIRDPISPLREPLHERERENLRVERHLQLDYSVETTLTPIREPVDEPVETVSGRGREADTPLAQSGIEREREIGGEREREREREIGSDMAVITAEDLVTEGLGSTARERAHMRVLQREREREQGVVASGESPLPRPLSLRERERERDVIGTPAGVGKERERQRERERERVVVEQEMPLAAAEASPYRKAYTPGKLEIAREESRDRRERERGPQRQQGGVPLCQNCTVQTVERVMPAEGHTSGTGSAPSSPTPFECDMLGVGEIELPAPHKAVFVSTSQSHALITSDLGGVFCL